MTREIDYIITTIKSVLEGEPWYGKAVMGILRDVNPALAYEKPNEHSHSFIELLYHMITWAEFTLKSLEKDKQIDMVAFEKLDWREIDRREHTWEKGMAQFKVTHDLIIELLRTKDDAVLSEKVDYREYNIRFLLLGLIQHDIYHAGQIAYATKLLSSNAPAESAR